MYIPLYYITSRRLALKLFRGLTDYDLSVFGMLHELNCPCHYGRLHKLISENGHAMTYVTFSAVLRKGVDQGYLRRSQVAGNACYEVTMEGKGLLSAYNAALDKIVAYKVRLLGNGLNVD
jgi:hypothetical protein